MQNCSAALKLPDNPFLGELADLSFPKRFSRFGYVSLFCGGGGLDLGFSLAGFRPLFSTDVESVYCETIAQNLRKRVRKHVSEPHCMTELTGDFVRSRVDRPIDIVIGGPPCQSCSILGDRKATQDPRGKLVFEFARFIKEVQPKAFLFENVPGILNVGGGRDWRDLLTFLEQTTGYNLRFTKLNSASYGVPQYRERVLLIGFQKKVDFEWPREEFALNGGDLLLPTPYPSKLAFERLEETPNHVLREHCDRVRNRYAKIKPGSRDRVDHTDRIHPERPSGTVLVGSGAGGGRPFIHPYEPRHITVREAARLQSFPDWWEFAGGPTAAYRQVGNAVPPLMARAVAGSILKAIRKSDC